MKTVARFGLALALLWVAGGRAAAQDACLTGASTLGDQRQLAALRQSIETACPCASFTGAPGANRGAYRSCAKARLEAALAGSTLRTECKRTGERLYKLATCGTDKIACGRFRESSTQEPVSCRIHKITRCADRARYEENACSDETHCADVVDWTAGTCIDPRAKGPFETGARHITFTKMSVVNPSEERALDTAIWYPTTQGAGPIDSLYAGVLDAPLDNSAGPYPLVLFSHGSCGYALQSTFLHSILASYGFIVVSPPHPGNTFAEFPTCGTPGAQVASAQERPQDMIFVLDQMLALNADSGSPFFGAIDPDKIAMSGHSFGGLTTYLVAAMEPRIKVAMPFAPAVPGLPMLTMPSLSILGQIDSVVNNTAIRNAYASALPPKALVEIEHAGHYAFSNGCFPSADCNPPTTLTQDEAHQQVLRWVVPFLRRYLAEDMSAEPLLDSTLPGVSVEQDR